MKIVNNPRFAGTTIRNVVAPEPSRCATNVTRSTETKIIQFFLKKPVKPLEKGTGFMYNSPVVCLGMKR